MDIEHPYVIDPKERNILLDLDSLLQKEIVRQSLMSIVVEAQMKLKDDPSVFFAWQGIPLELYGTALPSSILSSWVFVIRAGIPPEPHRHPNSRQRILSYFGTGDLQVWEEDQWRSNSLISSPESALEERWVSIPQNIWHRPLVREDWTVISFHNVSEEQLVEEAWANNQVRHYIAK
jgi:hypothetical protein